MIIKQRLQYVPISSQGRNMGYISENGLRSKVKGSKVKIKLSAYKAELSSRVVISEEPMNNMRTSIYLIFPCVGHNVTGRSQCPATHEESTQVPVGCVVNREAILQAPCSDHTPTYVFFLSFHVFLCMLYNMLAQQQRHNIYIQTNTYYGSVLSQGSVSKNLHS